MYSKNNFIKLPFFALLPFLTSCSADGNLDAKSRLEANPPVWVPVNSTLMFGDDGSIWADCDWQNDLYVCAFYKIERDAMIEQSYQLCAVKKHDVIIDSFAQSWIDKYNTHGLFFLPVTPPVYYEDGELQPSPKSDEEYRALGLDECSQKFSPVMENR